MIELTLPSSDDLNPGHRYLVAVETWNSAGPGLPQIFRHMRPGVGTPSVPTNLKMISPDPASAYFTWDSNPKAAGYRVWKRYIPDRSKASNSTTTQACAADAYLFPGSWNYEYCISAYNGNDESAQGPWIAAPHPTVTISPKPTCPGPAPWCPHGGGSWGPTPEPTSDPDFPGSGDGLETETITLTTTINGISTTVVETLGEFRPFPAYMLEWNACD